MEEKYHFYSYIKQNEGTICGDVAKVTVNLELDVLGN